MKEPLKFLESEEGKKWQEDFFKKNEEYGFTIENPLEKPTPKIKRNRLKEVSN